MSKKRRKRRSQALSPESLPPDFRPPSQQFMEGLMRQFLTDQGLADEPDEDLSRAQDLVHQAYETDDFEERLDLAQEALDVCPDCADAYVCVAEMAPSQAEALPWYQQGVEAGERALGGPKGLAGYAGHCWGRLETRPYMRARLGLAQALWHTGQREEAITHCRELLRLNPNDNQGVRYVLCSYYCDLGRDDELQRLLGEYPDDASAEWKFSRALLAFRREGDTERSRELLQAAHRANPQVGQYLVGSRQLPEDMPSLIALGGESEAVSYAANYLTGWRAAPGSVSWVRKTLKIAPPEAPVRGPSWSSLKHRASALPQNEGEVWQVDLLPTRFGSGGKKGAQTLWTLVVASATEGVVVGFEPCGEDSKPPPREILARVVEAMLKPQDEEPRRPETIQVRSKTLCKSWTPKLDEISVGCELVESLDFVESLAERVQEMKRAAEFSDEELADRADELADLLQHADEVWQADVRKLGTWITEEGEPRRPWGALVSDSASGAVLAQKLTMDGPSCELIRQALMAAMLAPALGEPHLPGMIQVASEPFRDELLPFLESLEIDCETCETLEQLDYIYGELDRSFGGGEQMAALSDTPGVTAKHVGGLFAAAAEFYRQTPWRDVPGDVPVHIHCDKFSTNNWYAVVMGQSGMTLGLAMYEDLDALKAILREDADADRRNSGLSLMFSEPFEIAIRDLDAAERHGWPVAGPEAYPLVLRVNPGLSVRPPLAWEIELLEASLRAIPPFIKRTERTPSRVTVPIATGELTLELSWVE